MTTVFGVRRLPALAGGGTSSTEPRCGSSNQSLSIFVRGNLEDPATALSDLIRQLVERR